MSIRVFISHSHEDAVLSRAVSALLSDALGLPEEQILNTSQPSTGVKAGSVVHEEVRAAMNSAEVCLVLITPRVVDSPSGQQDRRKLFLVVLFTVMDRGGVIEGGANALDVWCAYESLWKRVSSSRPAAVAVPLFGAGQSGADLTGQQSCALAVMSAICVALVQPIYPKLHLLCRDRESYRALDVRAIAAATTLEHGPRS
jgi:hypothetical protein